MKCDLCDEDISNNIFKEENDYITNYFCSKNHYYTTYIYNNFDSKWFLYSLKNKDTSWIFVSSSSSVNDENFYNVKLNEQKNYIFM